MGRPSKHSPEVRERAVRMVFDHLLYSSHAAGESIERQEHASTAPANDISAAAATKAHLTTRRMCRNKRASCRHMLN
jgi:hypothetical protein